LLNWLREIPEKGQISIPDDFKLDLCWTIFFPEKLLPHAFKATTTVNISHKLICRFSLNMKSGNEQ
jgi:hypothetical protein